LEQGETFVRARPAGVFRRTRSSGQRWSSRPTTVCPQSIPIAKRSRPCLMAYRSNTEGVFASRKAGLSHSQVSAAARCSHRAVDGFWADRQPQDRNALRLTVPNTLLWDLTRRSS